MHVPPRTTIHDEEGATAAEYVGVVLLVGLLIGALALTPVGGALGDGLRQVVCEILGTDCGGPGGIAAGDDYLPQECVTTATDTRYVNATVDIAFFTVGGNTTFVRETKLDGSVEISRVDTSEAGATAGVGFVGELRLGEFDAGLEAQAGVRGVVQLTDSDTWVFPPGQEQAALDFQAHIEREFAEDSIPVVNTINSVVEWITDEEDVRPPDKTFEALGESFEAGAGATGLVVSADAEVAASRQLGVEHDHVTGERSVLLAVGFGGDVSVAAGFADAGTSGGLEGIAKLTYDADGNPIRLTVSGIARSDAGGTANVLETDGGFGTTGTPATVVHNYEIDLDTQAARDFAEQLRTGNVHDAVTAGDGLATDARQSRVEYAGDTTDFGISAAGKLIGEIGIDAGVGGSTDNQIDMQYLGAPDADGNREWLPLEMGMCSA